jgi:hypothetical protein
MKPSVLIKEAMCSYAYQRQVSEESGSLRQVVSALIEELEWETARRESE